MNTPSKDTANVPRYLSDHAETYHTDPQSAAIPANLLLNTGPKADGTIPQEDVDTLRGVGRRLRQQEN